MENNKNEINVKYEKIDFKYLVLLLWKHKILIISLTLITTIVTGLFSVFIIPSVYQTQLNFIINFPEKITTKFGEYELPISTNQEYFELITSNDVLTNTVQDMDGDSEAFDILKNSIQKKYNVASADEQNIYSVNISSNSSEESKKLAELVFNNYIEYLNIMIQDRIVTYFQDKFSIEVESNQKKVETNKKIIEENKKLLEVTPQTINQEEAMNGINNKSDSSKFVILEDIINPNYTKIQSDIITYEQENIVLENTINLYNGYIYDLNQEEEIIEKYFNSNKSDIIESDLNSVIKSSVYLAGQPVAPSRKMNSNNLRNTIIGAFLGGIFSVLIAFIKEYWDKEIRKSL